MELILYYLNESSNLLITFLILMFAIGVLAYFIIRHFNQDNKLKVIFYGMLLRLNSIDVLKLSIVIVKMFLAYYATLAILNETMIYLCLTMIIILTIIYMLFFYKKSIYELFFTIFQIVLIYFLYIINNYIIEIEYNSLILMIKFCLALFLLIFTTYLCLRDVDIIVQNRIDKNLKKERKRLRGRKGLINGTVKKNK